MIELNNAAPRWYMDGVERSGDTTMIHTEYGRIRRNAAADSWKWDYFLKDHLGNVRVVLEAPASSAQSAQSNIRLYMATMEESKATEEDSYFANLDETRADRPYNYPDANPLNIKLAKVPGKSKGPSILLPVLAGDTISISAKAFYNMDKTLPGKGVDIAPVLGGAIVAMSSPVSGIVGEVTQLAVDLGAEASQSVVLRPALQNDDSQKEVKPQSGINFVLYNSRMEVVEDNTGILLVEDKINEIQTLASDHLIMQEAGFLEVYINNEAQTPVYYDNFTVAATTSNVVEINAYYPYGMLIPGLSLMAPPGKWNGYKYSAKELQTELGLNWGDHGARMADYTVGRWWVPDPLAEMYYNISTYAFAANNPIRYIDPNGMSIDKYFDELGNFLGDDLKGDNIRIMSKDTWDMFTEGESITELADVLQSAAPLFTQANLSEAAQLNVYNHFNSTGLPLTADNTSTNAGMIYRVSRTNDEVSEKIIVRLDANNRSGTSNRQSEVTNMFEHEGVHQVQYSQSGGFDNWKNLPNAVNERGAITHQVKHPSFSNTRQSYKDAVYRYGDSVWFNFYETPITFTCPYIKTKIICLK